MLGIRGLVDREDSRRRYGETGPGCLNSHFALLKPDPPRPLAPPKIAT
jgi:hypothetical protein